MQRTLLAVFFTLFISTFIFAQETEVKSNSQCPEIYLTSELAVKKYLHYPQANILGNLGATFAFNQVEASTFILGEKNMFDTFSSVVYTPLSKDIFDAGLCTIFHTEQEPKTYIDLDTLLGGYFSLHAAEHFIFKITGFYMLKATQISYIKKDCRWFFTNSIAFSLDFMCPINEFWAVGFELSSYNKTKFNTFFTPFFTLYGSYNVTDNLKLHCDIQANYIDMFTLSANLNNIAFIAGADWRLK